MSRLGKQQDFSLLYLQKFIKGRMLAKGISNRILRRIFGPKRDENGEKRRFHNEELHSLYRSPNIARMIKARRLRRAGYVARMEEGRSIFKILTVKRPLRMHRCSWEGKFRMDLKEIVINTRNWFDSVQDRHYWKVLVNAALNLRAP